MRRTWFTTGMLALSAAALAACAGQLRPPEDVRLDNCETAAQAIEAGRFTSQYGWGLRFITSCPERAGTALARAWQAPPRDSLGLEMLVTASTRIQDQHILEAALAAASAPQWPTLVRLSALRVLASYADPQVYVTLHNLEPRYAAANPSLRRSGAPTRLGATPPSPSAYAQVLTALQVIGTTGPDERVRFAAAFLAQGLGAGTRD